MLKELAESLFDPLEDALAKTQPDMEATELAHVKSVENGVAKIVGFTRLYADELLQFPGGLMGIASNLRQDKAGVIMLGDTADLRPGDRLKRTGRAADVPVGEALLGRVVDALGRPLDGKQPPRCRQRWPIQRPAPPIMHRAAVQVPLQTGIKAIDATIPIGRGQRELILGDRQTGKTAIAIDTILNQSESGIISIYCAIGQRASAVAHAIAALEKHDALKRTIVVVASGDDASGLQFVAPYAATTMAEFFMADGQDVMIIYDDLTRHARAYRELSLLLRRPPGREAYPGDIFYIHSRLLERASHLRPDKGGGSLTALPIVETQAQNISAYIPTNLISITDGQIYLSPKLFEKGHLPAIDIGLSVSRVGGKAQLPAYRAVAGNLRLMYSQFEELETFARFGTQLDDETRRKLARGERVREVLRQEEHDSLDVTTQLAVLIAATEGLLDHLPIGEVAAAEKRIRSLMRTEHQVLSKRINAGEQIPNDELTQLIKSISDAVTGTTPV